MANVIDQKIVEMRFDNKQFESGVRETMGTIKKLKQDLEFKDVNTSGLEKSVKNIEKLMSPLGGLISRNIGKALDSAIISVKNLFSEFSQIKAITSGFQEYETQMNAVQTILANTQKEGTTIKDVNKALDELNTYADKTIYNFTQMTKNIGTFTAAGVDLKTSVSAIQGIANLAAVSGSNAQQASTAMYQLSQALASGTVKLMDWNSVVNAGMGGQLFQDALRETSRLLKTGADEAIAAEGSFRESLKTGWLTTEVLTETLKKFTTSGAIEYLSTYLNLSKDVITTEYNKAKATYGEADAIEKVAEVLAEKTGKSKEDITQTLKFAQTAEDAATKVKTFTQLIDTLKEALQSGWALSFRILIGDFEEAKEMFTEISDVLSAMIGAQADARNRFLQEVFAKNDSSKFLADMLKTDTDTINALKEIAKESGTSSDDFINAISKYAEGDVVLTKLYGDLIDFANSETHVVDYIGDMFNIDKDSIRVLRAWGEEFGFASDAYKDQMTRMKVGGPIIENTITALLKMEYLMNRMSGRNLLIDSFKNLYRVVTEVLKPIKDAWREIFPKEKDTTTAVYNIIKSFNEFAKSLKINDDIAARIKITFVGLFSILKTLIGVVNIAFSAIKSGIKPAVTFIKIIQDAGLKISTIITRFKLWRRAIGDTENTMQKMSFNMGYNIGIVIEKLITLKNTILNILKMKNVQAFFKAIGNAFGFLGNKAKEGAIYIRDNMKAIWDAIKNFDFEKISAIAKNITMLLLAFSGFKALKSIKGAFNNLGDLLDSVGGALNAYARNMNATAILKMAGAIAILAISLVILTMVDSDKLVSAAVALSMLAAVIIAGASALQIASKKGADAAKALNIFAAGVTKAMNTFAKAAYWTAVGAALIAFSIGLGSVIASIVTIYTLYSKDADKLEKSIKMVGVIAAIMVGTIALLSLLNSKLVGGVEGMSTASNAMKAMAVLMGVTTFALGKVFAMALPTDWSVRLAILGGIFLGLAGLALAVGFAGRIAAGGAAPGSLASNPVIKKMFGGYLPSSSTSGAITAGPILALTATLTAAVYSLQKLFNMNLPSDYGVKFAILGGVFVGLYGLALAVGFAGKAAGNSKSLTTSILAMTLMLKVATDSVLTLMTMPFPDNYGKRLLVIEGMFASLAGLVFIIGYASKMAGGQLKATGTLISLAALIAVVTGSLKILGDMEFGKLIQGAVSLGVVLFGVAYALKSAGKISNADTAKSVWAMVGVIASIAGSLILLSFVPFPKLAKSVIALEVVLITLGYVFKTLSKLTADKTLVASIYGLALILGITSGSLMLLSDKPWGNVLVAAISMRLVLLALVKAFKSLNGMYIDQKAIIAFVACAVALIPMGYALQLLSGMEWGQMIAGSIGLGILATALSFAFGVISKSKGVSIKNIIAFVGMAIAAVPMAYALQLLKGVGVDQLLIGAIALGGVAIALSAAFRIMCAASGMSLSGIVTFAAMAVALIPIAYALKLLDGMSIGSVVTSLIALAGAITIMAIAAAIISPMAVPMLIAAAAIAAFGVAIGIVGVSLSLLAGGVESILPGLKVIGDKINKTFGGISKKLSGIFDGFSKGFGAGFNAVGDLLGQFFGWVGTKLAEIGPIILNGILNFLGWAGGGIVAAFKALFSAETWANIGSFLLSGFTAIGDGIIGIFASLGIDLSGPIDAIKKFFEEFKWSDVIDGFWSFINSIDFLGIIPAVQGFFSEFKFPDIIQNVKDFFAEFKFPDIIGGVKDFFAEFEFPDIIGGVKDFFAEFKFPDIIGGVKDFFAEFKFPDIIGGVKDFFAEFKWSDVIGKAKEFFDGLDFKAPTIDVKGFFKGLDFSGAIEGVKNFIAKFDFSGVKKAVRDFFGQFDLSSITTSVSDFLAQFDFSGIISTIQGFFNDIKFPDIVASIQTCLSNIRTFFSSLSNDIAFGLSLCIQNIQNFFLAFIQNGQLLIANFGLGIQSGFTNIISQMSNFISNLINNIKNSFSELITLGYQTAVSFINNLAAGLSSALGIAVAAIFQFAKNIKETFKISLPQINFSTLGSDIIKWILEGVNASFPVLLAAILYVCYKIIEAFKVALSRNVFYVLGQNIDAWLAAGIKDATPVPVAAAKALSSAVLNGIKSKLNSSTTYYIGVDAADGLAEGIESKINSIARAAIRAAQAAVAAARAALREASPSKVMIEVGEYFTEGFAIGIIDNLSIVKTNAKNMALAAMNSANDEVENYTIDTSLFDMFNSISDPIIRPTIDLSGVMNGVNKIQSIMDKKYNIGATISGVNNTAAGMRSEISKSDNISRNTHSNDSNNVTNYTFTQNNYSPKALTQSEIYRQTNNQFSAFRRMVNAT